MIVVVDLSNLIWSTFYSSLRSNRIEAETCPITYTGHLDFFHAKLVKILQDQPCNEYLFAIDRKPVNKFKLFPDYKKSRNRIDFDPKPAIMGILGEWNAKILYSDDNEADDVIASFIADHYEQSITVASTDKDLWQLCDLDTVRIYNFQKGSFVSAHDLKEAFDLEHYSHIKLHKALWGDSSDNVPNLVPRHQKSLLPIIKQTDGTLKDFWKHVERQRTSLSEKCLDLLDKNRDKLQINYELVRLNFDCVYKTETAVIPVLSESGS